MSINTINVLSLSLSASVSPLQTSNNYVALCQGLTFVQLRELRKAALFESCTHQITRNFMRQIIPTSFQQLKVWLYLIKSRLALSSSRYTLHKLVDGPKWRSGRLKKKSLLPLTGCPVLNPFSILTMLSQLSVWVWRIIHNRVLSLDSATASNDLILIGIFVLQLLYWTNYLAMSGGTTHWAGVADRKGNIDRGCLLALSKQSPPPSAGNTATLYPARSMNKRNYNIRKSTSDGIPWYLLSYCADL